MREQIRDDDIKEWARGYVEYRAGRRKRLPPLPKPFLLLVPPTLLTQWIGEIRAFSERFRVIRYHGDMKQGLEERGHDNTKMVLSSGHRKLRFRQNDDTSAVPKIRLVLSGHETWRVRHRPSSLKKIRPDDKTQRGVSRMKPPVKAEKWSADMAGIYRMVIVDEAHVLRNRRSYMHQSVEWVKTDFQLLMTATVVWTHPRDSAGLLSLCEPPGLSEAAEMAIGPLAGTATRGWRRRATRAAGSGSRDGHLRRLLSKRASWPRTWWSWA